MTASLLLTLIGLWVLLAAVWLSTYPLVARAGGGRTESRAALELHNLEAEKARLIEEIHELELDRTTGKLSEEDYVAAERRLKARAVEVMKEIEVLESAPSDTEAQRMT